MTVVLPMRHELFEKFVRSQNICINNYQKNHQNFSIIKSFRKSKF